MGWGSSLSTRKQVIEAREKALPQPNLIGALIRLNGAFATLLGGFLLLAEVNPTFAGMRQYASEHDVVLPACYAFWCFLYGVYRAVHWKLSVDLEEVRMENRRKGRRP